MLYDFLMLLRRYKVSSVLNIAGMGLAFAAAYLMLVQVVFDYSYNRSLPDAADIYRLEYPSWYNDGRWGTTWNRHDPLEYCAGIPEVEAAATFRCEGYTNRDYSIKRNDTIDNLTMNSTNCERAGLDVFGFECVAGSFDDFIGPYTAVISETAAKRLGLSVGDVIHSGRGATEDSHTLTIVAVYRDFPKPSSVANNDMFVGMVPVEQHDRSNWNDPFYLRLAPGTLPETVEEKMKVFLREQLSNDGYSQEEIGRLLPTKAPRLNNVYDIYFSRDTEGNDGPTGNISTTYTLLSIAVLVIVIAFINFINFFFALIPVRIRAVNTRKIFGASNARLRVGFVAETVGRGLRPCCGVQRHADGNLPVDIGGRRQKPAAGAGLRGRGRGSGYPDKPLSHILHHLLLARIRYQGLVPSHTLGPRAALHAGGRAVCDLDRAHHRDALHTDAAQLHDELRHGIRQGRHTCRRRPHNVQLPADGCPLGKAPSEPHGYRRHLQRGRQRMGWGREFRDKTISFQCYPVAWNFLDFMGIKVVEGRDFTKDDYQRASGVFIFNENAKQSFELTLDDKVYGHAGKTDIAGFCEDFHFMPLQYGVEPFCFYVFGSAPWYYPSHVYVRIAAGTGIREAIRYVREAVMAFDPSLEADKVHVSIFDEELGKYYNAEERLARLIAAFSLLSIVISMLGVFGLVLFETQYRRKEIGICSSCVSWAYAPSSPCR